MVNALGMDLAPLPSGKAAASSRRLLATLLERSGGKFGADLVSVITGAIRRMSYRMIPYARFPIGTTFPSLRGTKDTTAALARSSKAVAMYFA